MRVTHVEEARMRGDDRQQAGMWSYISPEQRVPADHPLRPVRAMVDTILAELSPAFAQLYSPIGRPSIPPEKLLRALLLQVLLHALYLFPLVFLLVRDAGSLGDVLASIVEITQLASRFRETQRIIKDALLRLWGMGRA